MEDKKENEPFLGLQRFYKDVEAIEKKYCEVYKDNEELCKEYTIDEICYKYEKEEKEQQCGVTDHSDSSGSEKEDINTTDEECILNKLKLFKKNYTKCNNELQRQMPVSHREVPLDILCTQSMTSPQYFSQNKHHPELYSWRIQITNQFSVIVAGYKKMESTALWHTTEIKDRVNGNRRMVQTHNGHVYVLKGKIDEEGMKQYGFSATLISNFHHGFPKNWQKIIQKLCSVEKRGSVQTGTRSQRRKAERSYPSNVAECLLAKSAARCDTELPFDSANFKMADCEDASGNEERDNSSPNSIPEIIRPRVCRPRDRDNADAYVWQLEKKRPHTAAGESNKIKKRKLNKGVYDFPANLKNADVFKDDNADTEEEDSEDEDYYWDD